MRACLALELGGLEAEGANLLRARDRYKAMTDGLGAEAQQVCASLHPSRHCLPHALEVRPILSWLLLCFLTDWARPSDGPSIPHPSELIPAYSMNSSL